jgi:hypothetical protein
VPIAGQNAQLLERLKTNRGKPVSLKRQSLFRLPHQKGGFDITSVLAGGDDCPGTAIPGGNYTAAAPFIDSGDTTGANNTVGSICDSYCYSYFDTPGPDHIYSFTLTARGANPQIQVSATSANYNPAIYILDSRYDLGCPAGTNRTVANNLNGSIYPSQNGTATIQLNFAPMNVLLHLFIDSTVSGANGSGPYMVRMQDVTIAPTTLPPPLRKMFDFDGDGKADISVFRPTDGIWYLNRSAQGLSATQFGVSTDKITPADYDGDGKTDIAVFRDGTWYLLRSTAGFAAVQFGLGGDIPVPADYTGDGQAELAVYRGGNWFTLNLQNNQSNTVQFGLPTDKPVTADYDGDARADYAVYRDGVWYLLQSTQGFAAIQFGLSTDKLVPADYDNDGKTDFAVYRDGTWYLQRSLLGFTEFQFGIASDIPAPADYNGDGAADAAVFRDGTWYLRQSGSGISTLQFGSPNDLPVPAAYLP